MNEFKIGKEEYEATPVPTELADRVQKGIQEGQRRHRSAVSRRWKRPLGAVAACLVVTVAGLNISPTIAAAAADVPVLGGLFQVLTVRSFIDTDGDRTMEVEQPGVTGGGLAEQINAEIQNRVDAKITEGNQMVEEYKNAFFATGGTEEEWEQHDNKVSVTYEVKSQTDTTVSFVVDSCVSTANAYQEQFFYNLDLENDKELTLADILGSDWVRICNEAIKGQMAAAEDPSVFFDESQGGFATVDESTQFYLNASGNPVVVFPKYTVAIGAMGNVEFEISK